MDFLDAVLAIHICIIVGYLLNGFIEDLGLRLPLFVTLFVLFPLMSRSYDAAIVAAGFGGVSLGSTPTAMANMAAVTQRFGASHRAFTSCHWFPPFLSTLPTPS